MGNCTINHLIFLWGSKRKVKKKAVTGHFQQHLVVDQGRVQTLAAVSQAADNKVVEDEPSLYESLSLEWTLYKKKKYST